jgi:hypothetical protein
MITLRRSINTSVDEIIRLNSGITIRNDAF